MLFLTVHGVLTTRIVEWFAIPSSIRTTVRILHGTDNFDWFKIGKEYIQAVYCHPVYLTHMQSIPHEMLGWMKHKLESRLPGEISITSDTRMTPPLGRKRRTKEPLVESERGE